MVDTLVRKDVIYSFSKEHAPVRHVASGSTLVIETYDCFENQISSNESGINSIDWERVNPATGPIFVENARPGDILKVKIDKIEIGESGVMAVGPGLGVMGHRIEKFEAKMIEIRDGRAIFNESLSIPLNPMIGVIGVAPEGDPIPCGTPGDHGGNMDTKLIEEGTELFLPIFAEGALFALGDLHAAMGDGEIGVSGIEVSGKVTVTFEVIKGHTLQSPLLKNQEGIALLVSAKTLDEAVKSSVEQMIDLLLPYTDLPLSEMTMLMSAIGQVQVSQVVDPLVTARFFVPNLFLDSYEIHLMQTGTEGQVPRPA
ncbi:acetamidase [Bacillus lacus]|uniref:Acetamidase n=1 Tax=Metabacillus lacus TaxID=1983721 RepID=A0A7X2IZU7_9BACI|nr:acetamidase/formamidase family protein [Metabacillus lacus]MRX72826.1 acetamidase [Metabacillus lacus]